MTHATQIGGLSKVLSLTFVIVTIGLAVTAKGCGGDTNDGPGPFHDAGTGACDLTLVTGGLLEVGQTTELQAQMVPLLAGARSYDWSVTYAGEEMSLTELSSPPDRVSFVPTEAGVYDVVVNAEAGGVSCLPLVETLNVTATGALVDSYRMTIRTPEGVADDIAIDVYGGADADVSAIDVNPGVAVTTTVVDELAMGVSAGIRARRSGDEEGDFDIFARSGSDGLLSMRLGASSYDLSIVPDDRNSYAATRTTGIIASTISDTLLLPSAEAIEGVVLDQGGGPIEGARVSLEIAGAPSTVATTSADGSFVVRGASGLVTRANVEPPSDSGLPRIASTTIGSHDSGDIITIQYQVAASPRTLTLSEAGTLALRGEVPSAATLSTSGTEALDGQLRVSLPVGSGEVVVPLVAAQVQLAALNADRSSGRVLEHDFTQTSELQIDSVPRAVQSLSVQQNGAPMQGVRLEAVGQGALASLDERRESVSDSPGSAVLSLVVGGSYALESRFEGLMGPRDVIGPIEGTPAIVPLSIPNFIRLSGRLRFGGTSLVGAHLSLVCLSCGPDEAGQVKAASLSTAGGEFELYLPDPGVASAAN